jgi:hypothetical protein
MARTTNFVNLDALIGRADMAETGEPGEDITSMPITGLEPKGWLYPALRKPDFQRETSNWSAEQVADLISTFLRRELIPAVILWRSGQDVFVIDGAHRLSALIAWVHNDYGDGDVSQAFFQNSIPEQQVHAAQRTREIVNAATGSYREHKDANERPDRARPEVLERAQRLGWQNIDVQWIRSADHDRAEKSFFRINQGGTKIDATEQRILLARSSATALSSRAILRGGKGHNYWAKFDPDSQRQIEDLGGEIHRLLFDPGLEIPIRTLDLPVAGYGYGSHVLPFVFDLVNITNKVQVSDSSNKKVKEAEEGFLLDPNGAKTVAYLTDVRRMLWRLCSNQASSLGLHPALYFYSRNGTFQPAALLSFVILMRDWDTNEFLGFTEVRASFEAFLLANRNITEAIRQLGTGNRSRPRIISLYRTIISKLRENKTPDEVANDLRSMNEFAFLIEPAEDLPMLALEGGSFTRETKGAAFLSDALPSAPKCPTCQGLMHRNGMQVGHKQAKRLGGSGDVSNAMMQHPFCNSTVRN